jgi:iron(III) transport system ATP-binding protein
MGGGAGGAAGGAGMSHVRLRGVSKSFGAVHAVREVSLDIERGELMAVLGPSGCGKTTLLRTIAGFERPDAGSVEVSDEVMAGPGRFIPPERRRIGMVFQDYALFPHLTVTGNIAFGLVNRPREEREALTRRTLELVGLQHKASRHPHELSGGERQRVALARALAPEPAVVLLDEPFSNLDATLRAGLRREVELILRDAEATALLVTHDQEEALSLADRVAVMREGRIVQVGAPEEVYVRPASRWAAQFVGEVNVLAGVAHGSGVETELGLFDLRAPASGAVHVAVRPEQLELRADHDGNAEVVAREFRGHDVLYRLRHEGGRVVLVQLPSLELYEVGARVFVRPAPAAVTTLVD